MVLIVLKKVCEYIEIHRNDKAIPITRRKLENAVNILEASLYTKFPFLFTF